MKLKNGLFIKIERAKSSDAEEVIDFLNIVGGESDNLLFGKDEFNMTVESERDFITSVNRSSASAFFIGRIDNEVVCFGNVMAQGRQRVSHQSNLALAVKRQYWGIGIGSHLMETLLTYARNTGQTEILHLGVRAENKSAIRLYEKMGFKQIGIYPNFFKINGRYYDEILMNLYL